MGDSCRNFGANCTFADGIIGYCVGCDDILSVKEYYLMESDYETKAFICKEHELKPISFAQAECAQQLSMVITKKNLSIILAM